MLMFNDWLAQQQNSGNSTATSPVSSPLVAAQVSGLGGSNPVNAQAMANSYVTGQNNDVDYQAMYDPIQEYYWDSNLGGQTVRTRKQNYQDDPYVFTGDSGSPLIDDRGPQYGDWEDVNMQDFLNNINDYAYVPPAQTDFVGDSGSPTLDYGFDPNRVDPGTLKGNNAFDYITDLNVRNSYKGIGDPGQWMQKQGIDLRESVGEPQNDWERAMQSTTQGRNIPKDYIADFSDTSPENYQMMFKREQYPFKPVAQTLNTYGELTGNTGRDFLKDPIHEKWNEQVDAANPEGWKRALASPGFQAILGMATAGLAPHLASGLNIPKWGANAILSGATGGLNAAANDGNIFAGIAGGAVGGGLGQYAGSFASNPFTKALIQGGVQGGTSALSGGNFGSGFLQGALTSGMNSSISELAPNFSNPELAQTLLKYGGNQAINLAKGKKFNPTSLINPAFKVAGSF